ncbi:CDGSH iron-sulfur domain-containing protein [Thiohalocapsa sp. ML1]|uniref:CDGSH iron-sulfur domain-containing protein n=1 Tax=Thiohalocapsa sp. ML1 TaxID=1431688 RepID=UPI0007323CC0|nr:CDGSH iron-sulfur domain-containing protein [Thiohalocapsa sp. ML1]
MSDKPIHDFPGSEIDVHWDERLCIHIGECGNAANTLFEGGRDPWCVPDEVSRAEVRDVCERCPSGALSYVDKTGEPEQAPAENTASVTYNGPLYLTGDLHIDDAAPDMAGTRFRAALCRCGASANKPFCDNSHLKAGFEDFGAVGETGPGRSATGGPLKVRRIPNGPLMVEGNLTIRAGTGRIAWQGEKAFLCRCGASKNKPFCDGSHKAAGFTDE